MLRRCSMGSHPQMSSEAPVQRAFERRRSERRRLEAEVRFATEKEPDAVGLLVNISESGLFMVCQTAAEVGDSIIAYPEGLGRLVGKIIRKEEDGVAVEFLLSDAKRADLSRRLLAGPDALPFLKIMERRTSGRTKLNLEAVAAVEGRDDQFPCRIVDLSETGAAVEADQFPPIGARVRIGIIHGVVARHSRTGFAIAFSRSVKK